MGGEVSTLGDVYSFGILLLEMFTGLRPTHHRFKDGLNIHNNVKAAVLEQLTKIIDPLLLAEVSTKEEEKEEEEEEIHIKDEMHKCLVSIFNIALCCSSESPRDRKDMKYVVDELLECKRDFFIET